MKPLINWLKRRVDNFLNAPNGSIVWGIKRLAEWIHEVVVALNALRSGRIAEKQMEEAGDDWENLSDLDIFEKLKNQGE